MSSPLTKDNNPVETVPTSSETETETEKLTTSNHPPLRVSNSGKPVSNTTKSRTLAGEASSLDENEADDELLSLDWVYGVFKGLSATLIPVPIGSSERPKT